MARRRIASRGSAWTPYGVLMLAAVTASACGGDGVLLQEPTGPPPTAATLREIEDSIFTPRCAVPGCHVSGTAPFGLVLEPGASWGNLVGVPSAEKPHLLRVEPGDVLGSYLYLKVCEGTRGRACGEPIAGSPMPLVGPPLTEAELERIASWILDGAPDN